MGPGCADFEKCLAMNNFSTMFAVLAGLNSSIVLRLKKTWEVSEVCDGYAEWLTR